MTHNPVHEAECEEARSAMRYSDAGCYRHEWAQFRYGLVCVGCGETVAGDEV